ncbi:MAG TPA: hypothetical protein VHZ55_16755 [Bryobacteraceae bacterium]|nr:hypothetical protein [Bryobacteraceae bacterium]
MEKHKRISATRMLKNANHLLGQAPQLVDPELAQKAGIEILKPAQLRVVHDPSRVKSAGLSERQLKALSSVKFETRSLKFDTGLFSGTVHVVDLSFRITGQNNQIIPLPANTIPIVIEYLTLAVNSVSQYTSQYGSHSVTISQIPLVAQVDVPTTSYNNGWLKNWVNTIAADANIPPTDCICILNPLSMVNSSAPNAEYGGFTAKRIAPTFS